MQFVYGFFKEAMRIELSQLCTLNVDELIKLLQEPSTLKMEIYTKQIQPFIKTTKIKN